jgi:putative phage-type endonuclease
MITKIQTHSHEEWLALRHKYIGGSDAAAVVGLNPFSSQLALWAEKTNKVPAFEGNLATEVGTYMEEFVAQKFSQETGKKVRRCNMSILNDEYPWAIANIDREIVGEDAGLEIKTTSELNMRKFKGGEYPANYYVQCMHYLAVTGKQKWYLAVLIGNREFLWFEIERDEKEIEALMRSEKLFYEYIENDKQPPADGFKATADTLKSLYPDSNGNTIDLLSYVDCVKRYLALDEQIKNLEELKKVQENNIKQYMGNAERAASAQYIVSWKTSERRSFDSKKLFRDHPELNNDKYYKTSSLRRFTVKEN